jgi:hypothetical protein
VSSQPPSVQGLGVEAAINNEDPANARSPAGNVPTSEPLWLKGTSPCVGKRGEVLTEVGRKS